MYVAGDSGADGRIFAFGFLVSFVTRQIVRVVRITRRSDRYAVVFGQLATRICSRTSDSDRRVKVRLSPIRPSQSVREIGRSRPPRLPKSDRPQKQRVTLLNLGRNLPAVSTLETPLAALMEALLTISCHPNHQIPRLNSKIFLLPARNDPSDDSPRTLPPPSFLPPALMLAAQRGLTRAPLAVVLLNCLARAARHRTLRVIPP